MPELTLTQSAAATVVGRGYLSSDHLSTATGLDPAIMISKNGGNFANPAAGASVMTEIEATGWYKFALATADTDTLGPLIIRGTHATMDNIEVVYQVVVENVAQTGDSYAVVTDVTYGLSVIQTETSGIKATTDSLSTMLDGGGEFPYYWDTDSYTSMPATDNIRAYVTGFKVNGGNNSYLSVMESTLPASVTGDSTFVDATWNGYGNDWCVGYVLMTVNGNRVYTVTGFDDATDTVTIDGAFVAAEEESPYMLVPWGPSGGGGDVTIADGAIKATTFDGTTAFPVTATDSGSTYIARTGADSDTLEVLSDEIDAVSAAISAIGSGTGAALNYEVTEDNASAPIKSISKKGTQTNDFSYTLSNDNQYHTITSQDDTPASPRYNFDWVYGFSVGAARAASKVVIRANMSQTGDTVTVSAYNFVTPGWDSRQTITGTAETLYDIPLLAGHTGTGSDEGKVYIRFVYAEGDAGALVVDECYVQAQQSGSLVGYSDGAIWVADDGVATTVPYVDGTADNPVTWAAAKTLATATGLTRFRIRNGSTVTLDATTATKSLIGRNWNLALGSQSISGSYIEGATVTGIGTGASAPTFTDCRIGAVTLPPSVLFRCGIGAASGTFTGGAKGSFEFIDCYSLVGSGGTPALTFAGLGASSYIQMRRWTAGSTLTLDADCACKIDSLGGGVHTVVTGGGGFSLRGTSKGSALTLSGSGTIDIHGIFGVITLAGTAAGGTVAVNGVVGTFTDGSTGATVTNNAVSRATINTEADTALSDIKLDHLIAVADSDDVVNNSIIAKLASKAATADWSDYVNTTDSLEAAADTQATAAELAKVPKSDAAVTWNVTALASINAEVDTALNTAIPGGSTADSINQRIAAIDDLTQASGAGDLAASLTRLGTPSNLGSGASVAANLVDIEGQTDDIGVAGAGLSDIPIVDANITQIGGVAQSATDLKDLVDTGYNPVTHAIVGVEMVTELDGVALGDINAEVDTALNTAIPGTPVDGSINQRVKAIDELTEASGSGDLAAILTDTGTTLDDLVDDLETRLTATRAGYLDNLSAGPVALETTAQSILTDTGTTLDGKLDAIDDYIDTEVAAIKAKTDLITVATTINVTGAVSGSTITIARGDTLSADVNGLGNIADYVSLDFTVKENPDDDTDAEAILRIRLNALGLTDGLLIINGATAADESKGSITVDNAVLGDITIALSADMSDDLVEGTYAYDIQKISATAVTTMTYGTCRVARDVTRAVV